MTKPFHLAWFTSFVPPAWESDFAGNDVAQWATGDFHVEIAQMLERACFDLVMLEDTLSIPDAYGRSMDPALRHGHHAPKGDPAALAVKLSAFTKNLGVVATMSTSFYSPFHLARLASTIDHMSSGRFGWNIVSTSEDRAAQNFGLDALDEHDLRYDKADEFLDVATQLWESWEPDALIIDRENDSLADPAKVKPIHFEGRFYRSRGPLNLHSSPQVKPTLLQAGVSPKGRDFAAKHADAVISIANGIEAMKELRHDIRARAEGHGRNPDDVKILFLCSPIVAATTEEAQAEWARYIADDRYLEGILMSQSMFSDIDFGAFDLNKPVPAEGLTTNGGQGSLKHFLRGNGDPNQTLRDLAINYVESGLPLVGTPAEVADAMEAAIDEVGGDGFLIEQPFFHLTRRHVASICDGLVPELQRRGLTRTEYTGKTLRANLRAF